MADNRLPDSLAATRGTSLAAALAAYDALAELGEAIDDEWTYVTALAEAGRARIRVAIGPDPAAPVTPRQAAALAAAGEEIARIRDPHRAIDWLSTFPAIVELVVAPPPAAVAPAAVAPTPGAAASTPGPDRSSPATSAPSGETR